MLLSTNIHPSCIRFNSLINAKILVYPAFILSLSYIFSFSSQLTITMRAYSHNLNIPIQQLTHFFLSLYSNVPVKQLSTLPFIAPILTLIQSDFCPYLSTKTALVNVTINLYIARVYHPASSSVFHWPTQFIHYVFIPS